MKNKYLENLNKIEFLVTYACTGRCKHCSEGEHCSAGERIDPTLAADAVRKISAEYEIKTVMAFGGEPLLYPDAVYAIMSAATEVGVSRRQIITNGYFTRDTEKIKLVARRLFECGVNDLLLSVDAFHQESIPLDVVREFARAAVGFGIPVRLQPAWLVSPTDLNSYNEKTREILSSFCDMNLPIGEGNVVFFEGNAKKYLSEYFDKNMPENPYIEDPCNVKCISFEPNGNVFDKNLYKSDVMEIIRNYTP